MSTLTQKILAAHARGSRTEVGDLITADVDCILANDITAPVAIRQLERMGKKPISDKIVLVLDHFAPNKDINSAEQCRFVREFAAKNNVGKFYDVGRMGVEHALLPEQGLVGSGQLIIGADSHTCTYGALGAFSTGVGSTDAAYAMAEGKCWFRVPAAFKIVLKGKFGRYVTGKDLILHLIGMLGVDGATYKSLEFCGDISSLSMDDRFTVCNMAVECGAKNAVFPVDDITREYQKGRFKGDINEYRIGADEDYERVITLDLGEILPTVAFPSLPSNVSTEFGKIRIDQVVIGSCTNGRIGDLRAAAELLDGKRKIADGVRTIIIPATQEVYMTALKEGLIEKFIAARAVVSAPTCGPCLGGHMGILGKGERAVSTTNRNFVGRMGHKESEVYLASPYVAMASAIKGYLTSPRDLI